MSEQPSLNGDGTITIKVSSWNRIVRERDEAREKWKEQNETLRTLAEHGENEIQKLIKECDEARNKMADALQEVDLRTLDYERMKQERDEAREKLARIESLLLDPDAVFLNFLHGKIAKLDWAKLEHIHGPHPVRVECDEAREKLNTNLTEISNKLLVAIRELGEAREECKEAQYESEQQSRLLGVSAEREYALRGKIFELERKILQLEAK